jgi:hypothetical protein
MVFRRSRRTTAALVFVSVLGAGLLSGSARAEPATAVRYPAGASGTWFAGKAFDACDAPSRTALQAWLASPYRALGVYLSGPLRACNQARLDAAWVTDVTALGWKILPLDVGLQAPCRAATRLRAMSRNPGTAAAQGRAAAAGALSAAKDLGILPGSAIYSDLEPYYASRDRACANAVRSYVGAWTKTLHAAGYLSGVYASHLYGATSLAEGYGSAVHARPDAIWTAHWDRDDRLSGWPGIPDQRWPVHQRVKQYRGDHDEVHGGIRLNIDSNVVDGPVATVALPYEVTLGAGLTKRDRPHLAGLDKGSVARGSTVRVVCQVSTTLGKWDKLVDGTYLPDAVVAGGSAKPQLAGCATPYQVVGGGNTRAGPGPGHPARGVTYDGALAWITCESPGTVLGRQGYWQRMQGGLWISGALLAVADPTRHSPAVPLCAG